MTSSAIGRKHPYGSLGLKSIFRYRQNKPVSDFSGSVTEVSLTSCLGIFIDEGEYNTAHGATTLHPYQKRVTESHRE